MKENDILPPAKQRVSPMTDYQFKKSKATIMLIIVIGLLVLAGCSSTYVNEAYYCEDVCNGEVLKSFNNILGGRTIMCSSGETNVSYVDLAGVVVYCE